MFKDNYDLEITCASDAALQFYLSGLEGSLCFDQPAIEEFREAVALDDDFALAHAALGRQLFIHGHGLAARKHLQRSLQLADHITPREQSAVRAICATASFEPQAMALVQTHVADYPRDVFVLAHLLGPFGMLAFSGSPHWHAQNVALLNETQPDYRQDDWWHLATRGFFCAEQKQLDQGQAYCERAWSISENGNTAHSLAHLHFEAGALEEGRKFIKSWLTVHGGDSNMRHHLVWHDSLLDIELGVNRNEIFDLYERELAPDVNEATPLEILADNASFLWRSHLSGINVSLEVCQELHAYAEDNFSHIGFAFADVHRAMVAALLRRHGSPDNFNERLLEISRATGAHVTACTCEYAAGFAAFCNEEYEKVVQILEPVLADSVLLGGSNPQRRIIEETYTEACVRAGFAQKARSILQARDRPFSKLDQELNHRVNDQVAECDNDAREQTRARGRIPRI